MKRHPGTRTPLRKRGGFALAMVLLLGGLILLASQTAPPAMAYPPAVGIIGQARNCLSCHADNGPWTDEENTIIDILDKETGESLMQDDGTFLIAAKRGENKTILTVIGIRQDDDTPAPYRNAWLYVDPQRIGDDYSLSAFAPGWSVNLPMACRIVGDKENLYPDASLTALPMTIRPGEDATDTEIELQVMLTMGESVKGNPSEGLTVNYFSRTVLLEVIQE